MTDLWKAESILGMSDGSRVSFSSSDVFLLLSENEF
jgi:hypothetical protein